MRRIFTKSIFIFLLNVIFLNLTSYAQKTDVAVPQEGQVLESNKPIERSLKGGESHSYSISLKANQFLRVSVEQLGIDVTVTMYAPAGQLLDERDRPNGTLGQESLSAEILISGKYRVEVKALDKEAKDGKYQIEIETPRTATSQDRKRIEAERAFQDGMKVRSIETTESFTAASEKYETASKIWNELGDGYAEGMVLFQLAISYRGLNQTDKAIEKATKALAMHQGRKDRDAEGDDLLLLGRLMDSQDKVDEAIKYLEDAAKAKEETGNRGGELYDFLADTYLRIQKLPKAVEAQKQAVEIHRNQLNIVAQIKSVFNLGKLYQLDGNDENATKCYEEAAQLIKTVTKEQASVGAYKTAGEGLFRLGIMKYRIDDFSRSIEVLERALTLFELGEDRPNIAQTHNNIGISHFSKGEHNLAEAQFQESLNIFRDLGDKSGEARVLFNLKKLRATSLKSQISEISVQVGHPSGTLYMVFSPDGKVLASTGIEGAIILWDVETRKQIRTLKGIEGPLVSCAFSPDGKIIVGGGFNFSEEENSRNTLKVWDVETGAELFNLQGHLGVVKSVAFSHDGKTIVSGGSGPIRQWDVASGQQIRWLVGGGALVALSPDGKSLISGHNDSTFLLWDIMTGKVKHTFIGHKKEVYSVAFSPTENKVVSASTDGTIKIWSVNTGEILQSFEAPLPTDDAAVFAGVVFSPDGQLISWADTKKTTRLWNVETGSEVLKLSEVSESIATAFSPDGKIFARGVGTSIKLWDIRKKDELTEIKAYSNIQSSASFSRDGEVLGMANTRDSNISLFSKKGVQELPTPFISGVNGIAFNQDGKLVATGTIENAVKLWNVTENKEIYTFKECSGKSTLSPNSKMLACVSKDKREIKLFDLASGKEIDKISGQFEEDVTFRFSPDGNIFAVESKGIFQLWTANQGTKSFDLIVLTLAFSFDGKLIAIARSNKVWIRKVDDLSLEGWTELAGHTGAIQSLEFSPDGKSLASGGWDKTIKLWDTSTFKEIKTLEGHKSTVGKIVFSPDGKTLISLGFDSTNKLWDISTGKEIVSLVSLIGNEWAVLTPDGLFDASGGGRNLLHYVIGLEPITLEQMKDVYYVPNLLQKIFKGEPLPKVELFSNKDLFPRVEYEPLKPNQKQLTVKLTNRGGGIGQVQVLFNGKELIADARPAMFNPASPNTALTIDLSKAPINVGEENKIAIVARNATGSLSTRGTAEAEMVYKDESSGPIEPPNIYAIVGGISEYTGDKLNLNFAAKDAEDFAHALELGAIKLLNGDKSKVHVRLLTSNGDQSTVKFTSTDARTSTATKADFTRAFSDFHNATSKDVFIVYLAGHGISLNLNQNPMQAGGDTYLYLTQEATTTDKTVLAVENSRKAMAISSEELKDLMKQNKALKQVLILDTCAAGALSNSLVGKRDLPSDQIRAIERLKDSTGFFVLMGASADAVSYEASQYGQGLLTYSLLQGMKGARLRENQFADVGLLFGYAQDTVPQMAKNIGGIQRPIIITPDTSNSFDIGKFTSVEQNQISISTPKPLVLRPSLRNAALRFDNLKLTQMMTEQLRQASYVQPRGEPNRIVFVDADEMTDAVQPVGDYTIQGDSLKISVILVKNNAPLAKEITVTGTAGDPAILIQQLIDAVMRLL